MESENTEGKGMKTLLIAFALGLFAVTLWYAVIGMRNQSAKLSEGMTENLKVSQSVADCSGAVAEMRKSRPEFAGDTFDTELIEAFVKYEGSVSETGYAGMFEYVSGIGSARIANEIYDGWIDFPRMVLAESAPPANEGGKCRLTFVRKGEVPKKTAERLCNPKDANDCSTSEDFNYAVVNFVPSERNVAEVLKLMDMGMQ